MVETAKRGTREISYGDATCKQQLQFCYFSKANSFPHSDFAQFGHFARIVVIVCINSNMHSVYLTVWQVSMVRMCEYEN